MKTGFLLAIAAFAAVIAGFLMMSAGIYSISSDETSRTLISYYWYSRGEITATSWLPLHFLIVGTALNFFHDLVLTPRIISLIFGVLTLIVTAKLTEEMFGKKEVTIYAIIILLFMPERLILSIVPLPEIIFFFFVASAALFFFRWIREGTHYNIIITAFMLSTANSLRYEGWIISFCFGLYSLFFIKNIKTKLIVLLIISAFPVFWFSYNYLRYNDLLYFLKEPENYYIQAQEDTVFNRIIFNPFVQFIEQLMVTLSIAGIAGVFYFRKIPALRKWVIVFFTPLILFSVFAVTGKPLPAHNFWRTSAVWIILLVPFSSFMIYKLRSSLAEYKLSWAFLFLFFIQLLNADYYYLKDVKMQYCLTPGKISSAKSLKDYIDSHSGKNDLVLIENLDNYEHFDITLASQEPLRFVFSKRNEITPNEPEKYPGISINYFLVKSPDLINRLQSKNNFTELFEKNGWCLFYKTNTLSEKNTRTRLLH